jgi:putative membrane-bound dehydrogenase-like protein
MRQAVLLGLLWIAAAAASTVHAEEAPFQLSEEFELTQFADDRLVHDCTAVTIDSRGRVAVGGPGYVKILHDADRDGRADAVTLFSNRPRSGPHGLLFDGNDLFVTGDEQVAWLRDRDGDGRADGEPEVWARLGDSEHGANGLVRGPDGWFYLVCGNDAGATAELLTSPASPVADPKCGAVLRFSPDGRRIEAVGHGFRNPYDLDFAATGQLLIVDSDNERDHYLPWYTPTRLFDVAVGHEHGWLERGWQRNWNRPGTLPDSGLRAAEFGRGSPTGSVVYRHQAFPERFRGGLFTGCWTLGKVYFLPLEQRGSSLVGTPEVFLASTGASGFAPVDLAVGPRGELFIAVGGRGTHGGIYRVTAKAGEKVASRATTESRDALTEVLTEDQPSASWSRSEWLPKARRLGPAAFQQAVVDRARPLLQRLRAIELVVELGGELSPESVRTLVQESDAALLARLAWALGRLKGAGVESALAELSKHESLRVQRAAWEALLEFSEAGEGDFQPCWRMAFAGEDRQVRMAAVTLALRRSEIAPQTFSSPAEALGWGWVALKRGEPLEQREAILAAFGPELPLPLRIEAVRLAQLSLGDMKASPSRAEAFEGYTAGSLEQVDPAWRSSLAVRITSCYPSGEPALDAELLRLAAMLRAESPELLDKATQQWTTDSSPIDDLHVLIATACFEGSRQPEVTQRTAAALLRLHEKMSARGWLASRNWPLRLSEAVAELGRKDPNLAASMLHSEHFGSPGHALFARSFPPELQAEAARRLLASARQLEDEAWTSDLIAALAPLPDAELRAELRLRWEYPPLREALLPVVARAATGDDRELLLSGLSLPQPASVALAAEALAKLPPARSAAELAQVIRALERQESNGAVAAPARAALNAALAAAKPVVAGGEQPQTAAAWKAWFNAQYPSEAALLEGNQGDRAALADRLSRVPFDRGQAAAGASVFARLGCLACHQAAGRLGPDLSGAAARFSRADLFAAVVDPSREVAPPYRTTLIATRDGKVYHGLVVYESPESTLLQTGADAVLRIAGDEIISWQASERSLMPEGLLAGASDQDWADLDAYLRSLTR